jgi:hypothetical protein
MERSFEAYETNLTFGVGRHRAVCFCARAGKGRPDRLGAFHHLPPPQAPPPLDRDDPDRRSPYSYEDERRREWRERHWREREGWDRHDPRDYDEY